MLMTKAAHAAVVQAKDAQISSLLSEIAFLRRLVQPDSKSSHAQIEADLVIEGRQDQVTDDQRKAAVDSEAAQLLSGAY